MRRGNCFVCHSFIIGSIGFPWRPIRYRLLLLVRNPSFEANYNDSFPHYGAIDEWVAVRGVNESGGPFHNGGTPIPVPCASVSVKEASRFHGRYPASLQANSMDTIPLRREELLWQDYRHRD
jgi:hypothetical protein